MAQAAPAQHAQADAQALDLAEKAIALRSVAGPGNQTPQVATLYGTALVQGGFTPSDVSITPVGDTAYLVARWPGANPGLKPLVISGHMDVVEARPADWKRDPFTPVVENGYLFGRGATDMKLDGTIAIASLIELKREGYRPRRTIIIEFSGDEETVMKTSAIIADKLSNADLVLNIDGGGGSLNEQTGAPEYFTWQGAEKTYADFQLTVTNPGGHSSEPRRLNAIDELAAALLRIHDHQFTPELSPLTRAYFVQAAKYEDAQTGAAMKAFAADPRDSHAIATLTANPATVGKIGTTCVVTLVSGGHAENALPQRAEANINCRIFPGHPRASIMAELQKVADDPAVSFRDVTEGSVATAASPMRPDFTGAVETAMASVYPGVPVFPSMASGASDSMWFRYHDVPSYGASPVFIKESEDFSHGLNERTPIATIPPSVDYYLALLPILTR
ncbi:M20/M25/M40 family metallo-hydrolase [Caulobacter sp. S45]|uniref:M20/M25/M40 family metallo-hydrolase n=1 Tax=Caulobacter sp. S45 TaxID=1641861 RepID=UPI00157756EC|nr:M20/M25/M40 family metallo-hydrolase [Caulobacter sp. S45]